MCLHLLTILTGQGDICEVFVIPKHFFAKEESLSFTAAIFLLSFLRAQMQVLRPRIPGDEPTFVFPKIKRAFLVHVLIGTFWLGRIIIFRPFCSDFSRARAECAYKRGGW